MICLIAKASATFDDIKIGYDNNADDGIDGTGDAIIYTEDFATTCVSPTYDNNGELTEDRWFQYTYDAWNGLVKAETKDDAEGDDVTIAAYTYDGTGRRIKKVVSNSGDPDATAYYYYAGSQMIETRNGSGNATRQN